MIWDALNGSFHCIFHYPYIAPIPTLCTFRMLIRIVLHMLQKHGPARCTDLIGTGRGCSPKMLSGSFPKIGGPQHSHPNTTILIIGIPKKVPLILGSPRMSECKHMCPSVLWSGQLCKVEARHRKSRCRLSLCWASLWQPAALDDQLQNLATP